MANRETLRLRLREAGGRLQAAGLRWPDREQHALEEGLRNLLAERDRLMGAVKEALEAHASAVAHERSEAERVQTSREAAEGRRAAQRNWAGSSIQEPPRATRG